MRVGPLLGLEKECLWWVRSSVLPAKTEYSPPEREVRMLIMEIVGGEMLDFRVSELTGRLARSEEVVTLFMRALGSQLGCAVGF